jgi:hypothetical protein
MRILAATVPPIVATKANVADPPLVGAFGMRFAVVIRATITTTFPAVTGDKNAKFQSVLSGKVALVA